MYHKYKQLNIRQITFPGIVGRAMSFLPLHIFFRSAYEMKNNFCLFESLFPKNKNGVFWPFLTFFVLCKLGKWWRHQIGWSGWSLVETKTQHNRCPFVSFVINISGAKFEKHCFNISRGIVYSVFYNFSCKPYVVIIFLISLIEKRQYL